MSDLRELLDEMVQMKLELAETRTMMRNMIRTGTVEERDAKKGYRINLGKDDEGKTILSPWYPHPEAGGDNKTWSPLAKGEIVTAFNPGGDMRQGFLTRGGFQDKFQAPSQSLDETVREAHGGKMRETISATGNRSTTLAGDEKISATGAILISADGGGHLA